MLCATLSSPSNLLRGGDFVGLFLDIDVVQDETGFDVEGVQHTWAALRSVKLLEASSECLAARSR